MASRYENPRTLICTATYNERDNVKILLDRIWALELDLDVLVVEDNSPDGTGEYLEEIRKEKSGLYVVHRPAKLGLGTAHQLGFLYAIHHGYDRLITMDADLSHDPAKIPELLDGLENADLVIGSRYAEGGSSDYGGYRKFLSVSANTLARILLGIPVREYTTSFRAFDVKMLRTRRCAKLKAAGYSFFMETVYRLHKAGFRVAEVPIRFRDRRFGVSKIPRFEIINGVVKLLVLAASRLTGRDRVFQAAPHVHDNCAYCASPYLLEIHAPSEKGETRKGDVSAYRCSSMEHRSKPRVVLCLQCGLSHIPPGDQPENLDALYTDVQDELYLANRQAKEINFRRNYLRMARYLPRSGKLLEIGAYCGLYLKVAESEGWEGTGIEPSRWAARIASEEVGVRVLQGTLADRRSELDPPYDMVAAWDMLEHVRDPYGLLVNAHELLRPGGVLCLSTLDVDNWFPRLLGRSWPWLMDMHIYYFTRPLLCRWLERAGFEVIQVDNYRHYANLRYIWQKGVAILPRPLAAILGPLAGLIPSGIVIPISFGDIKLFIARRHHDYAPAEQALDAGDHVDELE